MTFHPGQIRQTHSIQRRVTQRREGGAGRGGVGGGMKRRGFFLEDFSHFHSVHAHTERVTATDTISPAARPSRPNPLYACTQP